MTTTHDRPATTQPTPVCVACGAQMTTAAGGFSCPACGTTSGCVTR